jgi:hypothetical protein
MPGSDIGSIYFYSMASAAVVVLLLQIANAVWLRAGWPYALSVLFVLIFAFTQFMRLIRVAWSMRAA